MSTVAERKLVTFLRKLQSGGLDSNPLSYIKKIYSDRPRRDLMELTAQFPRLQVKELGGTSKFSGIGDTTRIYEPVLEVTVYVDMDAPFDYTDAKIAAFWGEGRNMSPEEAAGAISYHVSKELGENKATLHSDNSHQFILRGQAGFTDKGIDNEYFKNLNVYKAGMAYEFFLRD